MANNDDDPFTKSILPETSVPWRSMASSLAFQAIIGAVVLTVSYSVADKVDVKTRFFNLSFTKLQTVHLKSAHTKTKGQAHASVSFFPEVESTIKKPSFQATASSPVLKKAIVAQAISAPDMHIEKPSLPIPDSSPLATLQSPEKPREDIQIGTFGDDVAAPVSNRGNGSGRGVVSGSNLNDTLTRNETSRRPKNSVQQTKFDPIADTIYKTQKARADSEPAIKPVEIKYKPKPAYTDEARNKKIEGDVILEVTFSIDGSVVVKRVVKSLGYGLDEAAQTAAQSIKFIPAKADGESISSDALVHITFQLAS